MNDRPIAWVLNLDAEDELAGRGGHTPSAAMIARIERLRPALAGLIRPGDDVLWPNGQSTAGRLGRAWCPTPWALAAMDRAGVVRPTAPGISVLRRVNHRRFSFELGATLPGSAWVDDWAALERALSERAVLEECSKERAWVVKRPFGFAGRGRKRVLGGELDGATRAFIEASLGRSTGLLVEPWVERLLDVGLHAWLGPSGECTFGQPTIQVVDATGAWCSSVVAGPGALDPAEIEQLFAEARKVAGALHAAGYFGAFGVDAYRWRAPDGTLRFQPRSEINARYSMGWAIGMGEFRPPAGAP